MENLKKQQDVFSHRIVDRCQICDSRELQPILFLGYLPPVNSMPRLNEPLHEQPSFPAQLIQCTQCHLVQIGFVVDPRILFPPEYPYSSGTTRLLRDNFADLYRECADVVGLQAQDLIVDIGSNDGTLLSNFAQPGHRVLGVEPTQMSMQAQKRGIETLNAFFCKSVANEITAKYGKAKVITATNVFAHIDGIHDIVEAVCHILAEDGVFISESHYFYDLIEGLQYDTVYHEHLRYYHLGSLQVLLERHGLEIFHAKRIPTHGGSIRVYAGKKGKYPVRESFRKLLAEEKTKPLDESRLQQFKIRVVQSKLKLLSILDELKGKGKRLVGVGAPSRASTLINYVGLDDGILDSVLEVSNSHKIGHAIPGTTIPVLDESLLYTGKIDVALLLSWHIGDELMKSLSQKGFKGRFLIPLPEPRLLSPKA